MISIVSGTIVEKSKDTVVVMTPGGVGYAVRLTPTHLMECVQGQEVLLSTYMKVSDQNMELYGFKTADEKAFFALMLGVSGVGPKSAMNVLSIGSLDQIKDAIARKDVKYLTAVQGMGKKTAERLVVELKSKVDALGVRSTNGNEQSGGVLGEVIDGLIALGYSKDEARAVVQTMDAAEKTSEELLKLSLQLLAK